MDQQNLWVADDLQATRANFQAQINIIVRHFQAGFKAAHSVKIVLSDAREGFALAVLPPIAVRDELAWGMLIEAHALPGIAEAFLALTADRRFPNLLVRSLLQKAGVNVAQA